MIIPIRVPVNAPTYLIGGERRLSPEHPLYAHDCPVCSTPLGDAPITLVYVGMRPDDRKERGWTTGAAVAIHIDCSAPGAIQST